MLEVGQTEQLQTGKRRALLLLAASMAALVLTSALRFVPRLNDAFSGKPEYVHILTRTLAKGLVRKALSRFPVIVLKSQDDRCDAVNPVRLKDEDYAGVLYLLSYSEEKRFSCITSYVVPPDASRFENVVSIAPGVGESFGPQLLRPVPAVPFDRNLHFYPQEYLRLLHWRMPAPQFPLSTATAATLSSRSYYSTANPSNQPDSSASLELNFDELRAEIRKPHDALNSRLSLLLMALMVPPLIVSVWMVGIYRRFSQYGRLYHREVQLWTFFSHDLNLLAAAARKKYFAEEQQALAERRKQEALLHVREDLAATLLSALPDLRDDGLRRRTEQYLESAQPDLAAMKQLWAEIQAESGQKTPPEKLKLLLVSLAPYCNEEELDACRAEAFALLAKSGYRQARKFVVTAHDQFKMRFREMEELEAGSNATQS